MKNKISKIIYIFISLLIIVAAINLVISSIIVFNLQKKIAQAAEETRPENLKLTIIKDNTCEDCFDIDLAVNLLKKENVNITEENVLDYNSDEAKNLAEELNITKVPVFIAEGELDKHEEVNTNFFAKYGTTENNKFVFRATQPIYVDLSSGEKRGEVDVIYLKDDSCKDCYDVNLHKNALANVGIHPSSEQTYDINTEEGKKLIADYDIELVPTIILQGDIGVYPTILQMWPQLGKVSGDKLIFTSLDLMGTYKNLKTGELITPKK